MSSASYTEGPWKRRRFDDWGIEVEIRDAEWIGLGADEEDMPVCLVTGVYGDPKCEAILEANARLIAAAPNMADLLIEASKFEGYGDFLKSKWPERVIECLNSAGIKSASDTCSTRQMKKSRRNDHKP